MGVVYKFKSEVVDFVLQQKQATPGLSCRQLAAIVSKEFGLQVSKSSINTILKSAALSSPVGRRALSAHRPKPAASAQSIKKEASGPLPVVKSSIKPTAALPRAEAPPAKERKPPVVKLLPEAPVALPSTRPHAEPKIHATAVRGPSPSTSMQRHDGLGNIFFKAVEWSLSSKPILGEILKDYAKGFSVEDAYAASKVLLDLRAFGLSSIDELSHYKGTGLWRINQLSAGFDFKIVKNFYDSLSNLDEVGFRLVNEMDQLFTEIGSFKISCEDGQELVIDAAGETVLSHNVQSKKHILYNHLLSILTDQIINPKNPSIFRKAPGQSALTKEFYDLLMVYENRQGKSMTAVSLLDASGGELSQFASIPAQQRHYIMAIWPWQKEFDQLISHVSDRHRDELSHPLTSKSAYFAEINRQSLLDLTRQISPLIRGFLVTAADDPTSRVIVISNVPKEAASAREIIDLYWTKWPIAHEMEDVMNGWGRTEINTSFVPSSNIWENINNLYERIAQYAYHKFVAGDSHKISTNDFISMCCKTSGYWYEDQYRTIVSFVPADETTLEKVKILQNAAIRFNQSSIIDPTGRKIFVKIA